MNTRKFKNYFLLNGKRLLVFCVSYVVLMFLIHMMLVIYYNHGLQSKITAMKAKGYPTNTVELNQWYKVVPDDENMAIELQKAFDLHVDVDDIDISGRLKTEEEKAESLSTSVFGRTFFGEENEPSFADKVIFAGHFNPHPYLGEKLPTEIMRASEIYLKLNHKSLKIINEALKREKCRYPIDLRNGSNIVFSHLGGVREGIGLLATQAVAFSENGNNSKSIDCVIKGFRLAKSLDGEPNNYSYLTGNHSREIFFLVVEWLINKGTLTRRQLDKLEVALRDDKEKERIKAVLVGKAACLDKTTLDEIVEYGDTLPLGKRPPTPTLKDRFFNLSLWLTGDKIISRSMVLEITLKALEISDLDNHLQKKQYDKLGDYADKNSTGCLLFRALFLSGFCFYSGTNDLHAQYLLCRTMIAVEKYRLDNNKLPDSLKELVPEYLSSIPIDPFDGKQLKYRKGDIDKIRFVKMKFPEIKKDEFTIPDFDSMKKDRYGVSPDGMEEVTVKCPGYILYSVGSDGVDDHGTPDGYVSGPDITFTVIGKRK